MRLVVGMFLTMDGVMQGPGGPDEDRSGGFNQGGWMAPHFGDDGMRELLAGWIEAADGLLLGRRTYEIFAAHWPHVKGDDPIAPKLNSVRKYVVSRTLRKVDWQNSTLLRGDVPRAVARLKREKGKELQVVGSGELVQTLMDHELVDEFRLWTFPVVLGSGKRLFASGTHPAGMRLRESRSFPTGVVVNTYRPTGAPALGSVALDPPPPAEVERREQVAAGG